MWINTSFGGMNHTCVKSSHQEYPLSVLLCIRVKIQLLFTFFSCQPTPRSSFIKIVLPNSVGIVVCQELPADSGKKAINEPGAGFLSS